MVTPKKIFIALGVCVVLFGAMPVIEVAAGGSTPAPLVCPSDGNPVGHPPHCPNGRTPVKATTS